MRKSYNKRRRSGGYYTSDEILNELIDEAYEHALSEASFEAFEGKLSPEELAEKVNSRKIRQKAFTLIKS